MSRSSLTWLRVLTYLGIYGGLLVPLMFVPIIIFPFVFSKLIFFQVLIGLTFPAYLVLAWCDPSVRPKWTPLYGAIIAYFIALLISVVFAADPLRAFWGNQERMNGLFTLVHFLAWMTMTTSMIKTWEQWRRLLIFEIGLSVFMALISCLQKPFPNLLIFPATERTGGLLDNPIYMAAYQIFNLFFIALLWLKGVSRNTKIFLASAGVLDILAFIFAQSRGALLGLAVGVVVFGVCMSLMSKSKKVKGVILGILVLGGVSYGSLYLLKDTDWVQHSSLARFVNFTATTETRLIAWKIAWQGFLDRPISGWGLDNFHIVFNLKYNPESLRYGLYETWFDRSHNTVMDVLVMTGIIGFLTFFSIFGTLFYSVWRAYKKNWIDAALASIFVALPVAYFVQNLFVFDHPAGFTMSFFMYALIMRATMAEFIGAKEEKSEQKSAPVHLRPLPWGLVGGLYVISLLIVWRYSYLPAEASYYSIQSNNYFSSKIYPTAYNLAKQAAEIPTPYLDEQTFLQSRNLIDAAQAGGLTKIENWKDWHSLIKDVTERHLVDHGQSTHPLFIYSRYLDTMSRFLPEETANAEKYYKLALETSPKRQQLLYSYARFLIEHNRKQEGLDEFKKAADLDPELGESQWYIGLTLAYDLNKPTEGAEYISRAFSVKYPFALTDARQAVALSAAYATLNDKDSLRSLLQKLPQLNGGNTDIYLEVARALEHAGLTPERDILLHAMVNIDASLTPKLQALFLGNASTIQASIDLTPKATPPVQVASSSAESGPRK